MQQFEVMYGGKVEVTRLGEVFLKAEIKDRVNRYLDFYKDGKLIMKSSVFSFVIWNKIKVTFQDLPDSFTVIERVGQLQYKMRFGSLNVNTVYHPFGSPLYSIYLDKEGIAEVTSPKLLIGGYDKFTIVSQSDDDTINLYLLLALLIQMKPR